MCRAENVHPTDSGGGETNGAVGGGGDGGGGEQNDMSLPSCMRGVGWVARGDRRPTEKRVPFNRPTPRQVYDALPFVRRYFLYWMKHTGKKEKLFINTFQPLQHKPYYGVPIGGIGCGSMGRDFRGGFCKFSLRPGLVEHKVDVIPANQFLLSVRTPEGELLCQKVLCGADVRRERGQLSAWHWPFDKNNIHYRGLYPRSWTCYTVPELGLSVSIRQVSPVLPNDYEDSSLPACSFVVDAENRSGRDLEVSVALTWRNGTGRGRPERGCTAMGFSQQPEEGTNSVRGVALHNVIGGMKCVYGLATWCREGARVSVCKSWNPEGTGAALWKHLEDTGDVPDEADLQPSTSHGVAICVRQAVTAKSRAHIGEIALVWDMPNVTFGDGGRVYKRRYTRFFGSDLSRTDDLCAHVLSRRPEWEARIEEWQASVVEHPHLPAWYKSALFNELYFVTDGGSVWFEWEEEWSTRESQLSQYTKQLMRQHGRFGYLESWEYRMVNTYDVHFYASFALAQLWPRIELAVQAEFTDQIEHLDDVEVRYHMEGDRAPAKTRLRVPHDLGNPAADPWLVTNAYVMHDTGKWKDLNLKWVLTSWRDRLLCESEEERERFVEHVWPAVKSLLSHAMAEWDQDGDGMIENFGKADQTYDAWQMEGVSAYCGSLWLAALRVAEEMARLVADDERRELYREIRGKASRVFVEKLWNGSYFRFCERSKSRETVMADQLCGVWFLQSCSPEMAAELLPPNMVRSALSRIFELNVCGFAGGSMGAVNGMRPDGKVDRAYIQADEVWTGVTYAVAAFMIQQGEPQKAFDTASGCYAACFERLGLQWQTPEALYEKKFYRAIGYMRPLSIWAMQWALERHAKLGTGEEDERIASLRGERQHSEMSAGSSESGVSAAPSGSKLSGEENGSEGYGSEERQSQGSLTAR